MNRMFARRAAGATAALAMLVIGGAIGYRIARHATPATPTVAAATAAPAPREVLYWYDPMQPEQHFDHPGLSPMGMQMVPKYASVVDTGAEGSVRIDPAEVQNLGMRTALVKVAALSDTLQVPGTIAWDEDLAATVSARTDATIEKLYVRAPFTAVQAGQPLAEILAPQWSAAAAEYFALRDAQSATGRSLRAAALQRLHALGMDAATIRSLRAGSSAMTLRAPVSGVVSTLAVQQGQQVGAGAPILRINGLDKVWIDAAIPQAQSGGVTAGTPIAASVTALPGQIFHGKVAALLPAVDATTRTQRARIVLDNPQHDLAPGMFATLRIAGTPSAPHPLVPTEAIIATGPDTRVIEALGDGAFKPVRVQTGRSANGMTAIVAGLRGGERVVTSGQFLLDSEASLSGALQRMDVGDLGQRKSEPSPPAPLPAGEGSAAMPGMAMPAPSTSSSASFGKPEPSPPTPLPKGEGSTAMPGMAMPAPSGSAGGRP